MNESQTLPGFATLALRQDSAPIHGAESSRFFQVHGNLLRWTCREAHVGEKGVVQTSGTCSRNRSLRQERRCWRRWGWGTLPWRRQGDDAQCPAEGPERRDAGGRQPSRARRNHAGTLLRRARPGRCGLGKDGRPIGWMVSACAHSLGRILPGEGGIWGLCSAPPRQAETVTQAAPCPQPPPRASDSRPLPADGLPPASASPARELARLSCQVRWRCQGSHYRNTNGSRRIHCQ